MDSCLAELSIAQAVETHFIPESNDVHLLIDFPSLLLNVAFLLLINY